MRKRKLLANQSGLLFRISEEDYVYVLLRPLTEGSCLHFDEQTIVCETSPELGHKIAAREISSGKGIIKYGAPIGSAARDIRAGEHVQLHNIKSDHIPTYPLNSETD